MSRTNGTGESEGDDFRSSRKLGAYNLGFTILEILIVVALLAAVALPGLSAWLSYREATALDRATAAVRSELALGRMLAIRYRAPVRVRVTRTGLMSLESGDAADLSRLDLSRGALRVDSARIRPPWFRFNSRGHAAPGSIYLYRGNRGARVVSNFLGRTRVERFRFR